MRLKNKVAVVTASTRGIGRAIVTKFAEEGAIVYMAARNEERAQVAIDEYKKLGQTVKFVYNDATKKDREGGRKRESVREDRKSVV